MQNRADLYGVINEALRTRLYDFGINGHEPMSTHVRRKSFLLGAVFASIGALTAP